MNRNTIFTIFMLIITLYLAACGSDQQQQNVLVITVEPGKSLTTTHPCDGYQETLILDIDGIGPNGVRVRGVESFLQEGDPIIREYCGTRMIVGYIQTISVDYSSVEIMLLTEPLPVAPPEPSQSS
ncbi:MAG: hypothetical protein QY318_00015 [Candidatus Dojkabacteria bacterium]|nr:MAG: hypothetical protein QY318_00015 [Candidatus Dojkabacteria bacterium]